MSSWSQGPGIGWGSSALRGQWGGLFARKWCFSLSDIFLQNGMDGPERWGVLPGPTNGLSNENLVFRTFFFWTKIPGFI